MYLLMLIFERFSLERHNHHSYGDLKQRSIIKFLVQHGIFPLQVVSTVCFLGDSRKTRLSSDQTEMHLQNGAHGSAVDAKAW